MLEKKTRQKKQFTLPLDEKQIAYLNTVAKQKYFPVSDHDALSLQDVIRAIITKDMMSNK